MVRIFDSALHKLSAQRGEFVRISEYSESNTPWDNKIKPGDIVTNYPRYMSVSSDTGYLEQGGVSPYVTKAFIYYRFENIHSSRPLLKGSASLVNEQESVFMRDTTFRVKQIAISNEVTPGLDISDASKRIVVVLKEAPLPANRIAKNIHTGEDVKILM